MNSDLAPCESGRILLQPDDIQGLTKLYGNGETMVYPDFTRPWSAWLTSSQRLSDPRR
jgi:hypothetical protein